MQGLVVPADFVDDYGCDDGDDGADVVLDDQAAYLEVVVERWAGEPLGGSKVVKFWDRHSAEGL